MCVRASEDEGTRDVAPSMIDVGTFLAMMASGRKQETNQDGSVEKWQIGVANKNSNTKKWKYKRKYRHDEVQKNDRVDKWRGLFVV